MVSVISTLEMKVRKKCQSANMPRISASWPAARRAARPLPAPNHPGMIWRDWVHPNTQGMARRSVIPEVAVPRRDGREPIFIWASSSTGVEEVKNSTRPGVSTKPR